MSPWRYCTQCVLPDTRPGIELLADGRCNACHGHDRKTRAIDWAARGRALDHIFAEARARGADYDCIVPVSGGKDSTWQVVQCLERGLKVLAVTWRTPGRTALGQANLDNLIGLGVDHIDVSINPEVERRFTRASLIRTGSSAVPMHMAIFAVPLSLAVRLAVPLIVWGESPFMEYGGDPGASDLRRLDHAWLARHGILQGTTADDWVGDGLTARDLAPYRLPSEAAFRTARISSIFLGFYLPWDPMESLSVAQANGFQVRAEGPKLGLYDYADIDCDFVAVHHWFKWLKFGFTRLFDNLALEIRNGRMTREQAIGVIAERGDQRPGDDIARLCEFLHLDLDQFGEIEERWRNREIWRRANGQWRIDGFLVPDWDWAAGRGARPPIRAAS